MEAGDTRVADPVDTVHHEMDSAEDSTIRSHRFYKSVQSPVVTTQIYKISPVIRKQLVLEKELAGQSTQ